MVSCDANKENKPYTTQRTQASCRHFVLLLPTQAPVTWSAFIEQSGARCFFINCSDMCPQQPQKRKNATLGWHWEQESRPAPKCARGTSRNLVQRQTAVSHSFIFPRLNFTNNSEYAQPHRNIQRQKINRWKGELDVAVQLAVQQDPSGNWRNWRLRESWRLGEQNQQLCDATSKKFTWLD